MSCDAGAKGPCVPVRPPQRPLQQLLQRCNLRSAVPRSDSCGSHNWTHPTASHGIPWHPMASPSHCFPLSTSFDIFRHLSTSFGLLPASTAPSSGTWLRGFAPHADSASLARIGTATQWLSEPVRRYGYTLFLSFFLCQSAESNHDPRGHEPKLTPLIVVQIAYTT